MLMAIGSDTDENKNIPIVDDINDTGATFNWIKKIGINCLALTQIIGKVYGVTMLDLLFHR